MSEQQPSALPVQVSGAPVRLQFELTDADLRSVYQRYYDKLYQVHGVKRPLRTRILLWSGLIVFSAVLVLLLLAAARGDTAPVIYILLDAVFICAIASSLSDRRTDRRRKAARALDRTLKSCVLDSLIGPWTVELMPDGIRAEYAAETRLIKWPGVWGFHADADIVSVVTIDSRSIIIPLRAFPEPRAEHAAVFVRTGEQLLLASGHGYRSRLSTYLAHNDVLCPKCRYNLRGGAGGVGSNTGPVCPECGWLITPEHVPEAFRRAAAQA